MICVNAVSLHNNAYLPELSTIDSQGTDDSHILFNISNRVYYTDAIPQAGGRQAGYGGHSTGIPLVGVRVNGSGAQAQAGRRGGRMPIGGCRGSSIRCMPLINSPHKKRSSHA